MILLNFATPIKGASNESGHKEWIEVQSINLHAGRAIAATKGTTERDTSVPMFSEVQVVRTTDIASPDLFMQALCGKSLGKATLHFLQSAGVDTAQVIYITIELEDAIVSSYSMGTGGGEKPTEEFTINYTGITYKYDGNSGSASKAGTIKKYDRKTNKPG